MQEGEDLPETSLDFAWQDEALARDGVSREVPCSAMKGETVPDILPATPKSPPTRRVPPRVRRGLESESSLCASTDHTGQGDGQRCIRERGWGRLGPLGSLRGTLLPDPHTVKFTLSKQFLVSAHSPATITTMSRTFSSEGKQPPHRSSLLLLPSTTAADSHLFALCF